MYFPITHKVKPGLATYTPIRWLFDSAPGSMTTKVRLTNNSMKNIHELFESQKTEPVYLTSGCCENAHGSKELFDLIGLPYGEFDGDFYPLTETESQLIAEDVVYGELAWAYTGYTALFDGRKWLYPTMEVYFSSDGKVREGYEFATAKEADDHARHIVKHLSPNIEKIGGRVFYFPNATPDQHDISFLIPFEYAKRFGHYESWNPELTRLLSNV